MNIKIIDIYLSIIVTFDIKLDIIMMLLIIIELKEGVHMDNKKELVEVWGDVVSIKALLISIIISVVCTMTGYFLALQGDRTLSLFFGLAGALLGFIISTILIKPKRNLKIEE